MPMIYGGNAGAVAAALCGEVIQAMPNSKPDPQRLAFLEEYTWKFIYDSNLRGISHTYKQRVKYHFLLPGAF